MTRILYYLTIPRPAMPQCEALSQEIQALRDHVDGELVYLNPNQRSPLYLPRIVFGLQKLRQLRAREMDFDLHHLYNPDPFPFLVLRGLRRPVVYSVSGGIGSRRPNIRFLSSLAAVTVYDERSLRRLRSWGLNNVFQVRSGIDTTRFTYSPLPLRSEVRLLVGSAPWTRSQFRTKGVDALLSAAGRTPCLHLVFLWRDVLADEMERKVRRLNLEKQVTVLNRKVDVNRVLAEVHASITLATDSAIVKAYPHSLLESLVAGKPVLVSRAIPMADYVQKTGCGIVVEEVNLTTILTAVDDLASRYEALQKSAVDVGRHDFALEAMIASFKRIYERVV